jgi:hypothetical protein
MKLFIYKAVISTERSEWRNLAFIPYRFLDSAEPVPSEIHHVKVFAMTDSSTALLFAQNDINGFLLSVQYIGMKTDVQTIYY